MEDDKLKQLVDLEHNVMRKIQVFEVLTSLSAHFRLTLFRPILSFSAASLAGE